jgi:hypothetical protein
MSQHGVIRDFSLWLDGNHTSQALAFFNFPTVAAFRAIQQVLPNWEAFHLLTALTLSVVSNIAE